MDIYWKLVPYLMIFAKFAKIEWNKIDPTNIPADYVISLKTGDMCVSGMHPWNVYVMLQIVQQTLELSIDHTKQKYIIFILMIILDYTW